MERASLARPTTPGVPFPADLGVPLADSVSYQSPERQEERRQGSVGLASEARSTLISA